MFQPSQNDVRRFFCGTHAKRLAGTTVRTNFICSLGHGDPAQVFARSPRLSFDEACRLA
jgi:hypothetical protein